MKAVFEKALQMNGLTVPEAVTDQLLRFLDLLLSWNKVFRLTAIHDPQQAIWLHLIDSLSILPFVQGERVIDVGSGGGLPGIPLALLCPDRQFVLLDSNGKKTRFLQQVVIELRLTNVTVVQERVENFRTQVCFDSIITRAFASLDKMLVQTGHLSCPGGVFLAMKGDKPFDELAAIPAGYVYTVHRLSVVGLDAIRHLVCIRTGVG